MNTLGDSTRASHDLGSLRFSLKYLHKAIINFKGSFFVCQHGVEKSVTFDHGLEGSITEDSYFVIKASNQGYSFDWIEGEMFEQSPFTFMDIIRQRRRWHQGAYYIAFSTNLKRDLSGTSYMMQFFFSFISTIGTVSFLLSLFYPVSFHPADLCFESVVIAGELYFYLFGLTKNFNLKELSYSTKVVIFLSSPILVHYIDICNTLGFMWSLLTSKSDFHIVKKIK